jgi:hypothetical protein
MNSLKDYTTEVLMDEINQRDIEARTKVNEQGVLCVLRD